jgi:hypothetical protein
VAIHLLQGRMRERIEYNNILFFVLKGGFFRSVLQATKEVGIFKASESARDILTQGRIIEL